MHPVVDGLVGHVPFAHLGEVVDAVGVLGSEEHVVPSDPSTFVSVSGVKPYESRSPLSGSKRWHASMPSPIEILVKPSLSSSYIMMSRMDELYLPHDE